MTSYYVVKDVIHMVSFTYVHFNDVTKLVILAFGLGNFPPPYVNRQSSISIIIMAGDGAH